mmetsp:Transcript_13882/g.41997  ORF Transcript_13882/g.41997 Transcript_13882/m.41997 type:complete len:227 (+) Transcript_13882:347-1027(+)
MRARQKGRPDGAWLGARRGSACHCTGVDATCTCASTSAREVRRASSRLPLGTPLRLKEMVDSSACTSTSRSRRLPLPPPSAAPAASPLALAPTPVSASAAPLVSLAWSVEDVGTTTGPCSLATTGSTGRGCAVLVVAARAAPEVDVAVGPRKDAEPPAEVTGGAALCERRRPMGTERVRFTAWPESWSSATPRALVRSAWARSATVGAPSGSSSARSAQHTSVANV